MLKKTFKYIGYTILVIIITCLAIIGYLLSNKEEIVKFAVNQLNQQVTTKVEIGNADLALFRQFPKVSLDLAEVKIHSSIKSQASLLQAKHVYIGFNLFDIIRKNYRIKIINVDSALLNLYIDKSGRNNFDVIKNNEAEPQKDEAFLLELRRVVFSRLKLVYENNQTKQYYEGNIHNMELAGNFSSKGDEVACVGDFSLMKSNDDLIRFVKGKPIMIDLAFKIDHVASAYTFEKGFVHIDKLQLSLSGKMQRKAKGLMCDVKIGARNLDIPSFLSLVPSTSKITEDFTSKGNLHFTGTIVGELSKNVYPAINLEFGIDNGALANTSGLNLTDIQLKGRFTNGKSHLKSTSTIELDDFSFKLNNDLVKGFAKLSNFNDLAINTKLNGQLDVNELLKLFKNNTVKAANGNVVFDIDFKGKLSDLENKHFSAISSTGQLTLSLSDVKFHQSDKAINKLNASFSIGSKDVVIENFIAQVHESDVKVSGQLNNFIPYLLLNNQQLEADIRYQSDFIDLNHIVFPGNEISENKGVRGFELSENIILHAKVETGKFKYNNFIAQKVTATVNWKGKQIQVDDFNCEAFDGKVSVNGQIENAPDGRFLASLSASLNKISMPQLFTVCNNFGQTEITDKNIKGNISGTIDLVSVWSNNLVCDLNKLYLLANVQLDNGELNGFKPLESLSSYIDVQELRNVRFSTLKNTIQIKNRTIIVPTFEIKNSALNITMQGTHTLDNFLDYKLKVRLNDLLNKKRKPMENEFNEETSEGGVNLYLSMKGPIDNIKVSHDRREAKKQIKQDIKIEKQNIKEIFKKELGITPENTIKQKEKDNDELEFEAD